MAGSDGGAHWEEKKKQEESEHIHRSSLLKIWEQCTCFMVLSYLSIIEFGFRKSSGWTGATFAFKQLSKQAIEYQHRFAPFRKSFYSHQQNKALKHSRVSWWEGIYWDEKSLVQGLCSFENLEEFWKNRKPFSTAAKVLEFWHLTKVYKSFGVLGWQPSAWAVSSNEKWNYIT